MRGLVPARTAGEVLEHPRTWPAVLAGWNRVLLPNRRQWAGEGGGFGKSRGLFMISTSGALHRREGVAQMTMTVRKAQSRKLGD